MRVAVKGSAVGLTLMPSDGRLAEFFFKTPATYFIVRQSGGGFQE